MWPASLLALLLSVYRCQDALQRALLKPTSVVRWRKALQWITRILNIFTWRERGFVLQLPEIGETSTPLKTACQQVTNKKSSKTFSNNAYNSVKAKECHSQRMCDIIRTLGSKFHLCRKLDLFILCDSEPHTPIGYPGNKVRLSFCKSYLGNPHWTAI